MTGIEKGHRRDHRHAPGKTWFSFFFFYWNVLYIFSWEGSDFTQNSLDFQWFLASNQCWAFLFFILLVIFYFVTWSLRLLANLPLPFIHPLSWPSLGYFMLFRPNRNLWKAERRSQVTDSAWPPTFICQSDPFVSLWILGRRPTHRENGTRNPQLWACSPLPWWAESLKQSLNSTLCGHFSFYLLLRYKCWISVQNKFEGLCN